ncbi:hypothetical protein LZ32DRAFT_211236 [Colletotrichum eremochloae]|nr:hypothetical protein LZ32DRAFT_211236 [Colletotrichum eremochloae]
MWVAGAPGFPIKPLRHIISLSPSLKYAVSTPEPSYYFDAQPYESIILEIVGPRRSASSHHPRILQADVPDRPVGENATERGRHRRLPRPNWIMASLNTGKRGMVDTIRAGTSLVSWSPAATLAFRCRVLPTSYSTLVPSPLVDRSVTKQCSACRQQN